MEEETYLLNSKRDKNEGYYAIGQGYPCFLWKRRWIQICPDHNEELDPFYRLW